MRALVLAAGRGERMRPLSDATPKPLLEVRGRRLIEWHLLALAAAGVREVVVNTAWLEDQFPTVLGDGSRYGVSLVYSTEGRDHGGALETAGGIAKALPQLVGDRPERMFWVVSGDVYTPGFTFDASRAAAIEASDRLAHLWMAPNPPHHPRGDFAIDAQGRAARDGEPRYTWASLGLFRGSMFTGIAAGSVSPLRPHLEAAIDAGRLGAERLETAWTDVGTPERLAALNAA